jgi:hypothetical protein
MFNYKLNNLILTSTVYILNCIKINSTYIMSLRAKMEFHVQTNQPKHVKPFLSN